MDAIKIDRAQATLPAEARCTDTPKREKPVAEIRSLADWELALTAGGEGTPEWP